MSVWFIRLLSLACGLAVANLYYAQPLLGLLAKSFGVVASHTALVVTITQLGYALGLLLVVPLGDRLENRQLIVVLMLACVFSLLAMALAPNLVCFGAASMLVGVTSVVAQVLVPLAAHLAPEDSRGKVVGQVMSGLLLGILLARAAAGILSQHLGWRGVYALSAVLMAAMTLALRVYLPRRRPEAHPLGYLQLLGSLAGIFQAEPVLRRRAFYQCLMFGSFSLFWTGITFHLSAPPLSFSQTGIGMFALVGGAGALVAPWVGQLGDRGKGRITTGVAFLLAALGFLCTGWQAHLWALALGSIVVDVAVQSTLILGQQQIYNLRPEQRSRLNTLYIAIFFLGGAVGSGLAGPLFAQGGWNAVVVAGATLPLVGLLAWATEKP